MAKEKTLPAWAHAEIRRIDKTHGAQKPFCMAAKIRPETFKRLVKCGSARCDVSGRVLEALEQKLSATGASAKKIAGYIEERRSDIMASISTMSPKADRVPRMLTAFILRKDAGLDRRTTAEEVGYTSLGAVNQAEKNIYDEIESNKAFRKLVYEIKADLGY